MDTIVLFHPYRATDPGAANYDKLPAITSPPGCKSWHTAINRLDLRLCWIKVNCHDICNYNKATRASVRKLTRTVKQWLGCVGLTVDDFTMSRIDYDYNVYLLHGEGNAIMDAMQLLPSRALRMDKSPIPSSVYYLCKSRHAQWYDKEAERRAKGQAVKPRQHNLVRQEVQCLSRHIRYMQKKYGLLRTWDNWVSVGMEAHYLTTARPVFPPGDFRSLNAAADIIQRSTLTPYYKRRLVEVLSLVRSNGFDTLTETYSRNSVKNYLGKLAALNICPLLLDDSCGIDHAANPFRRGGAA